MVNEENKIDGIHKNVASDLSAAIEEDAYNSD